MINLGVMSQFVYGSTVFSRSTLQNKAYIFCFDLQWNLELMYYGVMALIGGKL